MSSRFLISYTNPDAGIGHSMGIINQALKIALRNNLELAYSEEQLVKSSHHSWKWQLRQALRMLSGHKRYESHNIGNDLNGLLDLKNRLCSRESLETKIKHGELKLVEIPFFKIEIPSNDQIDDEGYKEVDAFINSHTEQNLVFKIGNHEYGDSEYALTKNWLVETYEEARSRNPIPLKYDANRLNIALHIRRGDLLPGRQFSDLASRMLPDSWYLEILEIIAKLTTGKMAIHIFSEGQNGQYRSETGAPFSWREHFKGSDYQITEHIDTPFVDTFHHLLHADILLGSKSGMTHLAGMLGKQIKVLPHMWHSYRGASSIIEVTDLLNMADKENIKNFLIKHLKSAGNKS